MSQFDQSKWRKNQLLQEEGLLESVADQAAKAIDNAISSVDESLSYKDFALAVAKILKDEYGAHNFNKFMEILHTELGMNESLNESEADFADEFKEKFDVRASLTSDRIEVLEREDIDEDIFEEMIKFIEDKGYTVDRKQSDRYHEVEPGERDFFPRIRFSK